MAQFQLRQGAHYHRVPPFAAWPWVGTRALTRRVVFGADCAYDSAPYNAQDVNKLCGLSFGWRGVHYNSARFGWRWSNADQCVELLAYCYCQGARNWDAQLRFPVVAQVRPGQDIACALAYANETTPTFTFTVRETGSGKVLGTAYVQAPNVLPSFGLVEGLYFGGELTAPHDMHVLIDRL